MNTIILSAILLLLVIIVTMIRARGRYKRKLIGLVDSEWNTWGRQLSENGHIVISGARETEEPFAKRVGDFWESDGYSYDGYDTDEPWSAVFISYFLKISGAEDFDGSASHSSYIRQAVQNRKKNMLESNYVAYRHHEKEAEVGDLVCYSRMAKTDLYDETSSYKSHCDIVVQKNSNNIEVIGGNVSNGVTKKIVSTSNGKVLDQSNKWFAIIKNNQTF